MNQYESGERKIIPATLIYAFRNDDILMLSRTANPNDYHFGKWNGLGGKLEVGENILEAAAREFEEESGIKKGTEHFQVLGTIHFPNFKPHKKEDWWVTILTVELSQKERPILKSPEGDLKFIQKTNVLSLKLWAGDRHFLPLVIEKKSFLGSIEYTGEIVTRYFVQKL